jgi:hypothetical protein
VGAVHAGDYEKITGARSLESESRRKQIATKVTKVSSEVKVKRLYIRSENEPYKNLAR